jgi:hypothetical protein
LAFTTPRTWTTGEVVTAALLNAQIKGNMDLSAPAILTTAGDIIYASGANTPARLAKDTNSTRVLTNTGSSNVPAWAQVTLTSGVSGTLPIGNGGTGATTLTDGGVLLGNGTGTMVAMAVLADGEIVVGDGTTDPVALAAFSSSTGTLKVASGGTGASSLTDKAVLISQDSGTDTVGAVDLTTSGELVIGGSSGPVGATLTAGSNVTITNGDGSISIAAASGGIASVAADTTPQVGGSAGFDLQAQLLVGNGGTTGIAISANGEVTMAAQPAVLALNSSLDSNVTGNGTQATVDYDDEIFDQNGDFASDTFTAPVTGRYLLVANIELEGMTAAGDTMNCNFNGANRSYTYTWNTTNNLPSAATAQLINIMDMDASDTVICRAAVSGESSDVVDVTGGTGANTSFSICLLV